MRGKILMIVSLLASSIVMNSCLKDKVGLDWTDSLKGKMYAEVWRGGFSSLGLAPIPDSVTFKFLVNIATDQPPTQDITVTMAVSEEAMNNYNAAKGTAYLLYPYIDIVDKNLVIKAGTRNAYCHVKIWNAHLLDACDNYMAPIIIQSATGGVIAADPLNMGSCLKALPISNPWAGDYNIIGYRIRPGNATEPVTGTETLSTIDCKTVYKIGFGNYTAYNIRIEVTSETMVVGGVTVNKVIATPYDPATGSDVGGMFTTWTGDPATPPAPPANATDINYYNPETKQFVLNCYYLSGAGNRIMYEVLTRL
jgi:hypothetical protein